jgi:endonuclease G
MENGSVFIVTGPVLTPDLHKLPSSRVSIPELFFKVVLDTNSSHLNGIGFLLANKNNDSSLTSYIVTIDSVQKITGLNFFYLLPDSIEKQVESVVCIPCWSWDGISNNTYSGKQKQLNSVPVQCGGITKSGKRCARTTSCPNGRCFQHGCK